MLAKAAQDITPRNGGAFPWAGVNADKFEAEWSMKPVVLKGFLDHDRETKVTKWQNGEKGVEVITPFYTHLDSQEKPCGILVNRGWMPWDLMDYKSDRNNSTAKVQGILYRGDAKTKYSKSNQPSLMAFNSVYPEEIALMT